ncbi:MAG: hypothetical protein WCA37_13695 [Terracidiphilus sp.]
MRRALALVLMLFFGLGPLTATLQAEDDSRLPACCRRHGAHHCAMADAMRAQMVRSTESTKPVWTAPDHCPLYPQGGGATTTPPCAMAAALLSPHLLPAWRHAPHRMDETARRMTPLNRTGRSPPLSERL